MKIKINNKRFEVSQNDFINEFGRALIEAIGFNNSIHWKLKRTKEEHEQDSLQNPLLTAHRMIYLETQWGTITLSTDPKDTTKKNRIRESDGVTYYILGIDFDLPVSAKMGEEGVFRLYNETKIYNNTHFCAKNNKKEYKETQNAKIETDGMGSRSVVKLGDDKAGKIIARNKKNKNAENRSSLPEKEVKIGTDIGVNMSLQSYSVYKKNPDGVDQEILKDFITMPDMNKSISALYLHYSLSLQQWFSIIFQVIDLSLSLNEGSLSTSKKQLLHRDLKPDNIMVILPFLANHRAKNFNEDPSVALCDYETVIEVGTDEHEFCGTLLFTSPEIMREMLNDNNIQKTFTYSFATEIYTLGATLLDILLHVALFFVKNPENIAAYLTIQEYLKEAQCLFTLNSNLEYRESIPNILKTLSNKLAKDTNIQKVWNDLCQLSYKMQRLKPADRPTLEEARKNFQTIYMFAKNNHMLPNIPRKVDLHHRVDRKEFNSGVIEPAKINKIHTDNEYIIKAAENHRNHKKDISENIDNYGFLDYKKYNTNYQSNTSSWWFKKHGNSGIRRAKELVDSFLKKAEDNDELPDLEARREGIATFFQQNLFGARAQNNAHSFIRYFLVACKEKGDDLKALFVGFDNISIPTEMPKSQNDKASSNEWFHAFKQLAIEINNKKDKDNSSSYSAVEPLI